MDETDRSLCDQLIQETEAKKLEIRERNCKKEEELGIALQKFRECMSDALESPATTKWFHEQAKLGNNSIVFGSAVFRNTPVDHVLLAEKISSQSTFRLGNQVFERRLHKTTDCFQTLKKTMTALEEFIYAGSLQPVAREVASTKGFDPNMVRVDVTTNHHLDRKDPEFWNCQLFMSWKPKKTSSP